MATAPHSSPDVVITACLNKLLKVVSARRHGKLAEDINKYLNERKKKTGVLDDRRPGQGHSPHAQAEGEEGFNTPKDPNEEGRSSAVVAGDGPQGEADDGKDVGSPASEHPPGDNASEPAETPRSGTCKVPSTAGLESSVVPDEVVVAPDLVLRTEAALSDRECSTLMAIMRAAVETGKVPIIEAALDCIQKLIAYRCLQGAAYSIRQAKPSAAGRDDLPESPDPLSLTPQAQAIELICKCEEIPDEGIELHILKGLLTATTSTSFTVHGQALLLAVRTCYNIYLMSRSEVNQGTAKATLTQLLNVIFQRLEADSVLVHVEPIVVAEVLGKGPQDGQASVVGAVQNFLNSAIAAASYAAAGPTVDQIKTSVAGAFNIHQGQHLQSLSDGESEDEKEHFRLGQRVKRLRTSSTDEPCSPVKQLTEQARQNILQKDAFLVFRALCKLSIRTSDSASQLDPTAVRGKVLALELLKILLENCGPSFRRSDRFVAAIRQYLCLSLLKNSASAIPTAMQLSCSIFISLLLKFRASLKAEVGVFFPMILLKYVEPPVSGPQGTHLLGSSNMAHRLVVLRCMRDICQNGELLVDLFVNYDCDLDSSNLFERMVSSLVKLAQGPGPSGGAGLETHAQGHDLAARVEALDCVVHVMIALRDWYKSKLGVTMVEDVQLDNGKDIERAPTTQPQSGNSSGIHLDRLEDALEAGDHPSVSGNQGHAFSSKRAYKAKFQEGVALFNTKPKKGIAFLQGEGMLGSHPEDIAQFLAKTEGLDKSLIGDYLGEREDMPLKVMHAYVDALEFTNMEFDLAIRKFLQGFRLPGEAQKIDRLMEKFAERFVKCNPGSFKSADVAYVLAYSVIMLNTDAHNAQVKNKMSKEDFVKNNRGINDGADLPLEFMSSLYDRIVHQEIKMKDEGVLGGGEQGAMGVMDQALGMVMLKAFLNIMGGHKQQVSSEPSDEAIKKTLDNLHNKAKGATFYSAVEADTVRPVLDVIWAPLLGLLSVLFDEFSDKRSVSLCLSGLGAGAELGAELGINGLRDIFVNSLCNFTHLHSPSQMKSKNAQAFKQLVEVALQVGDHLEDRWVLVLRCVSRWELLQQIASGMPTDAVLFTVPNQERGVKAAASVLQQQLKKLGRTLDHGADQTSMDSLGMNEVTIRRAHIGSSGNVSKDDQVISQEIINSVDTSVMNAIFVQSVKLDSEAVVQFVRALTSISLDELRDAKAPRVFSLTKIVEIAHYNMTRIRLVWSRIWTVLSEYFITVGCHANLSVAMYAVDSLRQLAMKFLERDELANYTFQNDFLRPFVVVMRQSSAVEIRELIIRCLSQMVLARVTNVKSGWKSMFMVFTTAAGDKEATIVRLAFDTIEKIVREHFVHITETESTTFTDCVNCLIAFTNNPHSLDVALNSIAFLRFCAIKLAEGDIGSDSDEPSASEGGASPPLDRRVPSSARESSVGGAGPSDRGNHIYYWFPLLAGLSELTFDPRPEIRYSALEVLFDILKFHGATFGQSFWSRIFDRVLLPIFDHVRAEVMDTTTFTTEKKRQQEDAWLYETCTQCLQHLIDMFVQFYEVVRPLLGRLLELLKTFIERSHQSLASVGVAALLRLVQLAGPSMDESAWNEVMAAFLLVIESTSPDVEGMVQGVRLSAGGQEGPGTSGGGAKNTFSLREGAGARRLAKFRCQRAVQLLLVQAGSEIYASNAQTMPSSTLNHLLTALELVSHHARKVNTDRALRAALSAQQLADRVPEDNFIADPPLLRLETDSAHAYLSILLHLTTCNGQRDVCQAETRLFAVCRQVLERFAQGGQQGGQGGDPASQKRALLGVDNAPVPLSLMAVPQEFTAFTPLVVSILRALGALKDPVLRPHAKAMFPVLTSLVRCQYASGEIQAALSDLFLNKFGPMLGAAMQNGLH